MEVLEAMSPYVDHSLHQHDHMDDDIEVAVRDRDELHEISKLNSHRILRAYQLKVDSELRGKQFETEDLLLIGCDKSKAIVNDDIDMHEVMEIYNPKDFRQYMKKVNIARETCYSLHLVPLYCYTSVMYYGDMVHKGIRLSQVDQSHVGVYFTTKGPCSLGLGTDRYEEKVLEHLYGKKYLPEYINKGLVDLVIVYGAEPCCVEESHNNRVNYGQHSFEDNVVKPSHGYIGDTIDQAGKHITKRISSATKRLSASGPAVIKKRLSTLNSYSSYDADNNDIGDTHHAADSQYYTPSYLRPDRIMAAIHLNHHKPIKVKRTENKFFTREIKRDERNAQILAKIEIETENNGLNSIDRELDFDDRWEKQQFGRKMSFV